MQENDSHYKHDTKFPGFNFETERNERNLFWHLFPDKICDMVVRGNAYIAAKFNDFCAMTEQEFENFWGLIFLGCLYDPNGGALWDTNEELVFQYPQFDDYMSKDRHMHGCALHIGTTLRGDWWHNDARRGVHSEIC